MSKVNKRDWKANRKTPVERSNEKPKTVNRKKSESTYSKRMGA